jgi:hypothetical protein
MSKEEKAMWAQMQAMLAQLQNPKSNPAQDFLTNEAIAGANFMKAGEFGQLPKGMFFDFKGPQEQVNQYKKYANVNQGGTFALANGQGSNAGRTAATGLQGKYLADKFARDAGQNYQDNIAMASNKIQGALGQAAGAKNGNDAAIMAAMQNMMQLAPKKTGGGLGGLLGLGASIASAF